METSFNSISENENIIEPSTEKSNNSFNVKTDEQPVVTVSPNITVNPTPVSVNVTVSSNEVSVNSVSLNYISSDEILNALSKNSVSVNVSNNYVSTNTVVSFDDIPFWKKPFSKYSTTEGLLFMILVVIVMGFYFNHMIGGLKHGNI